MQGWHPHSLWLFNIATDNGPTYQHNPLQYRTAMADAAFQSSQSSIGWKCYPWFPWLVATMMLLARMWAPQLCVLLEITHLNT